MKLFIIDGIGPFFRGYERRRINWSKIPFDNLEREGRLDTDRMQAVTADFRTFVERAAAMGFNAVSLDDLAHIALHPSYSPATRQKIEDYRAAYARLFAIAAAAGMGVYLTTDMMFEHPDADGQLQDLERQVIPFLREAVRNAFARYPALAGIIVRIGECDGKDVQVDFRSRLVVQEPGQARKLLRELLPVFEQYERHLVFRTWTVGAYRIGDLIWNRRTFDAVFRGLDSSSLVISMKYGETDYFRYLPLNPLFFRSKHQKIVELQTRREYEGFGEYPSFVGWEYENYARELAGARNMLGAMVWCQTGGWSGFRRRTLLDESGVWNEINTYVTVTILRYGSTTEQAVERYCREHMGEVQWDRLLVLLRLSDEVVRELLYIDEFARRKLFFRRVRIPPLLSVFWDHVIITHSMRKLLRCFVMDGEGKIAQGYTALRKLRAMRQLAQGLPLPERDLEFQYDTFEVLAAAREYYFAPFSRDIVERLQSMKRAYADKYESRYHVVLDFSRFTMPRSRLRFMLGLGVRRKRGYRLIDQLVIIRLLSIISPILRISQRRFMPDFAQQQAMGIETLLK